MGREGDVAVPIRTRLVSDPLPATVVVWMVAVARIDGRCRIDHWLGRNDDRLRSNNCWLIDNNRLCNNRRGWSHDRRLSDHHWIRGDDVMRERDRCRRKPHNARREAEAAVMVVVVVMPPREYARRGRQRKSHNKDFLRVHDSPLLSFFHRAPSPDMNARQTTVHRLTHALKNLSTD